MEHIALFSLVAYIASCVCSWVAAGVYQSSEIKWTMLADSRGTPQLAIVSGLSEVPRDEVVLRDNVTFQLYTRDNSDPGYRLYLDDIAGLQESGFDRSIPTKIIAHGYTSDLFDPLIQDSKSDYLTLEACNVIGVGYGSLVPPPLYNVAKQHALLVGRYVGELVEFLVQAAGAELADFHLIGHSLGGQVVGIAGGSLQGGKVARISGLDPALPLFGSESDDHRIDPTDAYLVDVTHCDGGVAGFWEARGHVDFYPNGGKAPQPGCGIDIIGTCSHNLCKNWFTHSILDRLAYPAVQCDSIEEVNTASCSGVPGIMGDAIGNTPHGIYYLTVLP